MFSLVADLLLCAKNHCFALRCTDRLKKSRWVHKGSKPEEKMTAREDAYRFNSDLVARLKAGQLTVASLYGLAAHRPLLHLCEVVNHSVFDISEVVRCLLDAGHHFNAHPVPIAGEDGDGTILNALPNFSLDLASGKLTESAVRTMAAHVDLLRICEAVGRGTLGLEMVVRAMKEAHDRANPFEQIVNKGFWHRRAFSPELISWLTYHVVRFSKKERKGYEDAYVSNRQERSDLGFVHSSFVMPAVKLTGHEVACMLAMMGDFTLPFEVDWSRFPSSAGLQKFEWKILGLSGKEDDPNITSHSNSLYEFGGRPGGPLMGWRWFQASFGDLILFAMAMHRHPDFMKPRGSIIVPRVEDFASCAEPKMNYPFLALQWVDGKPVARQVSDLKDYFTHSFCGHYAGRKEKE
jgi:hypothetical protein